MPKTPVLSGEEMIEILKKIGFRAIRQRGDHVFLERIEENRKETSGFKTLRTVVPLRSDLGNLLKTIMKEVEISDEDLLKIMDW